VNHPDRSGLGGKVYFSRQSAIHNPVIACSFTPVIAVVGLRAGGGEPAWIRC